MSRTNVILANQYDKQNIKVGKPGASVLAAEQRIKYFEYRYLIFFVVFFAGDHVITKVKIIPLAILLGNVPKKITGSFYLDKVHLLH